MYVWLKLEADRIIVIALPDVIISGFVVGIQFNIRLFCGKKKKNLFLAL